MKQVTIEFSGMYKNRDEKSSLIMAICSELYPGQKVFGLNIIYDNGKNMESWDKAHLDDFPKTTITSDVHQSIYLSYVDIPKPMMDFDYKTFYRFEALLIGGIRELKDYSHSDLHLLAEMVSEAIINEEKVEDILNFFEGYMEPFDNRDIDHACFYSRDSGLVLTPELIQMLKRDHEFEIVGNDLERY